MEILSALIQGTFGLASAALGFTLGLVSGIVAWFIKARSIKGMLADEVEINRDACQNWQNGQEWPVRSNYIWRSLQPVVPGLLRSAQVKALANFYYRQSVVYKKKGTDSFSVEKATALKDLADSTLVTLGRKTNK